MCVTFSFALNLITIQLEILIFFLLYISAFIWLKALYAYIHIKNPLQFMNHPIQKIYWNWIIDMKCKTQNF